MRLPLPALALALPACTTNATPFSYTFNGEGVGRAVVEAGSGFVTYRAIEGTQELHVSGVSTSRALGGLGGGDNAVDAYVDDVTLRVTTDASLGGEVDLYIEGPVDLDLDITAAGSAVTLDGVSGAHWVEALSLEGTWVSGQVHAEITSTIDLELIPDDPGISTLTTVSGDVALAMPYGGAYSLDVVIEDAEQGGFQVEDLGFDQVDEYETSLFAMSDDGSAEVNVTVGGTSGFTLTELDQATDAELPNTR